MLLTTAPVFSVLAYELCMEGNKLRMRSSDGVYSNCHVYSGDNGCERGDQGLGHAVRAYTRDTRF